jgi:hypothetical protein
MDRYTNGTDKNESGNSPRSGRLKIAQHVQCWEVVRLESSPCSGRVIFAQELLRYTINRPLHGLRFNLLFGSQH